MPCDTVTTVSLEIGVVNDAVLAEVFRNLKLSGNRYGFSGTLEGDYVQGSLREGRLEMWGRYLEQDKLAGIFKRAISKATVTLNARRLGWTVKETGVNKFELLKR